MRRLAGCLAVIVAIVRTTIEEKIRYPAAALAYYAFVSFVPLLVLVFAAVGGQYATELSRTFPQFLTPAVRRLVDRSVTTASGRTGAGLLAVAVLGWSGANFVGDVRTVVQRVEGTAGGSLGQWLLDAVAVVGSLVTAALTVVTVNLLISVLSLGRVVGLVAFAGLWLALTVAFVALYYVPSGLVTSPWEALPGAVTASFGWTLLQAALHLYSVNAGRYAVYGVLSGVIILLTTLYLAALVLLVGFVVNAQIHTALAARDE
ncbi:hypothetical protein C2R22_04205 [Salinigranum rubrum]|uniref:YihY/virulence factor BrkB family protein n=1 Tax=Salinigranum rubrum TaxID=755307 RepID=A0A2I8VGB5_9EURY|nr:YhjD/YihY/BrkB family envelope integrity protein [Salinigranum rubrum]AUV80962.1 hypothetical protein C2R22_04205 [Salinigranum rubrum]